MNPSPSPVPADAEDPASSANERERPDLDATLRVLFVTMLRPDSARRFVRSVRAFHPDMPISFAEQTDGEGDLADLESAARRLRVPFDAGLAACRNRLIDETDEEFFLLADDDFYVPAPLQVGVAQRFLRANPEVPFVGGHITDCHFQDDQESRRVDERRDANLALDTNSRGLVVIPRAYVGGEDRLFEGVVFERCDYVPNWGVGRTSFFKQTGFRWSDQLKIGLEGLDFFLRLKLNHPKQKVFFCRKLQVDHHIHRDLSAAYLAYRERTEFIETFGRMFGLEYLCDPLAGQVKFFDDFGTEVLFPRPDRERANRDRQRLNEIRERYEQLKARYAELRETHLALKNRLVAKKQQTPKLV